MAMVDGSIGWAGIAASTARSHSVSATVAFEARDRHDVAGLGLLQLPLEAAEGQDLGDAACSIAGRRGSST